MRTPRHIAQRPLLAALLLTVIAALTGCAEIALQQKERQMELLARDWSMTIRASQVVPVYPLTQDLMPGDVFLVQTPIAEQSRRFRDRGFLPTDLQIARLAPDNYARFYTNFETPPVAEPTTAATGEGSGDTDEEAVLRLPRDWRAGPPAGSNARTILKGLGANGDGSDTFGVTWRSFPRAGFPSYAFEVGNSGGLSAALPVQGIPVALSVTGAARATGSVTIADAVSYGVDAPHLYARLSEHLAGPIGDTVPRPPQGEVWFLRVITRVFAAKRFDILITATSTSGGGLDVGAPKSVADVQPPQPLPLPGQANAAALSEAANETLEKDLAARQRAYAAELERAANWQSSGGLTGGLSVAAINERLRALDDGTAPGPAADGAPPAEGAAGTAAADTFGGLIPGASLRATFASGRTIGFREVHIEPLVVGYQGFDVAIDSAGNIGPIVPTFVVLDQAVRVPPPTGLTTHDLTYLAMLDSLEAIQQTQPARVEAVYRMAAETDSDLSKRLNDELTPGDGDKQVNATAAWRRVSADWIRARGRTFEPTRRAFARDALAGAILDLGLDVPDAPQDGGAEPEDEPAGEPNAHEEE